MLNLLKLSLRFFVFLRLWKSYGCQIVISLNDVTTLEGCHTMFRESMSYGQIDGIFNLAGKDNI